MIPRIDEMNEPPVVGQFYMVPTVTGNWHGRAATWPVLGPKHNDLGHLNFEPVHYHIDARFLTDRAWSALDEATFYGAAAEIAGAPFVETDRYGKTCNSLDVTYRRRRCARPSIGHVMASGFAGIHPDFVAMHAAYLGHQCPKGPQGWICPHKGVALGSIQPEPDGTIVCPLHGLRIDAATGLVVPTLRPAVPS